MTLQKNISICGVPVGEGHSPFIVAEMSANHLGSLDRAFRIIDAAKKAGADAVKIQTYQPDTITIRSDRDEFTVKGGLWNGRSLYDLYEKAQTPFSWHEKLFAYARDVGIPLFSAPFDETAVGLLESLGAPAYKIASCELVDIPLIRRVAETGKPMIVSTGMANESEIALAVGTARAAGCDELVLLHCLSSYPANVRDSNLRRLVALRNRFGCPVGLSDHSPGNETAVAAIAMGGCVIEKHLTLSRGDGGPDAAFSLEPEEFGVLVRTCKDIYLALGDGEIVCAPCEEGTLPFRRSLYVVADVRAGEFFTDANVRSIRPAAGLPPVRLDSIIGLKAKSDIKAGTPLSWNLIAGGDPEA